MRIAVVGSGIAGNAAAWTLSQRYPVTVYERELRPGGHSHTVTVGYDGEQVAVDTGFIVYNELNYPDFTPLLAHLGVETVASSMSFALSADHGRFEWKGGGGGLGMLQGLFAQPSNLLSPSYLFMLRDILRFNRMSVTDLRSGRLAGLSLNHPVRRVASQVAARQRGDLRGQDLVVAPLQRRRRGSQGRDGVRDRLRQVQRPQGRRHDRGLRRREDRARLCVDTADTRAPRGCAVHAR